MVLATTLRVLFLLPPLAHTSTNRNTALEATKLTWTDGKAFVQNSGWNTSVDRLPYARLPLAAKSGEWCSPPCPVRTPVWREGQNGAGIIIIIVGHF